MHLLTRLLQVAKDQVVDFFAGDAHGEDKSVPVVGNSAVVRLRGRGEGQRKRKGDAVGRKEVRMEMMHFCLALSCVTLAKRTKEVSREHPC